MNLIDLKRFLRDHPTNEVNPFWMRYAIDDEFGGVYSYLDVDGRRTARTGSCGITEGMKTAIGGMSSTGTGRPGRQMEQPEGDTNSRTSSAYKEWLRYDIAIRDPFHLPRGLTMAIEVPDRLPKRKRG